MRSVSQRTAVIGVLSMAAILAFSSSAMAFEVTIGPWSGPAAPDGPAATATVTILYDCGSLLPPPLGESITLEATTSSPGSVNIAPTEFEVQAPVADCTPGEAANETATLTYGAVRTLLAGSAVSITVTATAGSTAEELAASDEKDTSATVGTYLFVTYAAVNASYEVHAGETIQAAIRVTSESNTQIMAMPTATAPEGWPAPDPAPLTVDSSLVEGATGAGTISFEIGVPMDAEPGEYTVSVRLFSHNAAVPEEATESVTVPLSIQVLAPLVDPDANGSPAPGAALLVVLLAAIAALRRRRAG